MQVKAINRNRIIFFINSFDKKNSYKYKYSYINKYSYKYKYKTNVYVYNVFLK